MLTYIAIIVGLCLVGLMSISWKLQELIDVLKKKEH